MPIFFCYAHEDKEFVDQLASQLVQQQAWVWIDRWELNVGDSIVDRVQTAIEEASAVIIVLSSASLISNWVKRELSAIVSRQIGGESALVVPVLIEDCPIPILLSDRLYADFRESHDDGLRMVMEAISCVTSASQGRLVSPDFHTDWAVDWGERDGYVCLHLTMIEQAAALGFCVLTEVEVIGNDIATMRYRAFANRGFEWVQHGSIMNVVADWAKKEKVQFVLPDARIQRRQMGIRDSDRGIEYTFTVSCRWIGTATGKSIVVGVGRSLELLCHNWKQRVRPPTSEELREIALLINQ